jgi:fructan beta-fructosidase
MKPVYRSQGQGLVEYVLLIALVIVGTALVLQLSGVRLADVYCRAASAFSGDDVCAKTKYACEDNFDAGLDNWSKGQGAWQSQNGSACASGGGMIFDSCSADLKPKDYTIYVSGAHLTKGNGYGVFFRTTLDNRTNTFNGYTFQYDPGYGGGAFIFRKWVNGKELSPFAVAPAKGYDWYSAPKDVTISIQGDQFTAYIDGVAVLTGKDSSFTEGGAGLRSWDASQVCVDGFRISVP